MSSINKVLSQSRTKLPILGETISWALHGFERSSEAFKTRYEELELPNYCYVERRTRSALTKALNEMEKDNLIRKISDDEDSISFMIVTEDIKKADKDIDFIKRNVITYDKFSQTIKFKNVDEFKKAHLKELFEKYQSVITGREVSQIFVRLVKYAGAITLNQGGGFYFIPKKNLSIVDKMENLLLGSNCGILRLGITDQQTYKSQMVELARKELVGEVRKIKDEIVDITNNGEEELRNHIVDTRMEKISRFKERVGALTDLGFDKGGIQKEIDRCKTLLKRKAA